MVCVVFIVLDLFSFIFVHSFILFLRFSLLCSFLNFFFLFHFPSICWVHNCAVISIYEFENEERKEKKKNLRFYLCLISRQENNIRQDLTSLNHIKNPYNFCCRHNLRFIHVILYCFFLSYFSCSVAAPYHVTIYPFESQTHKYRLFMTDFMLLFAC